MVEKDFNDVSSYPNKLIKQLRRQVAIAGLPYNYITNEGENDNGMGISGSLMMMVESDEGEKFIREAKRFQKQYRYLTDDSRSSYGTWEEFNTELEAHMTQFEEQIDMVVDAIINDFADMMIEDNLIISTRNRIERERREREKPESERITFSATGIGYCAPAYMRWLVNSWNDLKTEWQWKDEDWDSDISYAMRGYLLARNKQDGSGFDVFGVKTIQEAKALAEPHIPREGLDIFINALDAAGYERSELPQPWQGKPSFTIPLFTLRNIQPDFEIKHANDDYMIVHIQNVDAAYAFGQGTSWCTAEFEHDEGDWNFDTFGHTGNAFDDYSDNLLVICNKHGHRFQVHLRNNQFHNEADNTVDWMELCDDYPKLLPTIISLCSDEAYQAIPRHVRSQLYGIDGEDHYVAQKKALIEFANARLSHSIDQNDIEGLCQLFNAVSDIDIDDLRNGIWLSFGKKSILKAIEIIPDIELSIEFFIENYWYIGEEGREYMAEAGMFSMYEEWLKSQNQKPLPPSITDVLRMR